MPAPAGVGSRAPGSRHEPIEAVTAREAGRTAVGKADDGDRTRDPQLGKLMLYQLSYVRARPVYRAVSAPQLSVITTGAPIST